MDAQALQALLEAAARELGSVSSELRSDDASLRISGELAEAQEAIQEAIAACSPASAFGIAGLDEEPSEVLQEACALRADAVRARDIAESQLWSLQDEQGRLLERLRLLSGQYQQRLEEQQRESDAASSRETVLVERCEQLNNEVRGLRSEVDVKSQRLIACSAFGHSLELTKRKLQQQHEGSLVENTVAREILELQQGTEAHLQWVGDQCSRADQSLQLAHNRCAEQMEGLQSDWSEEQAKYSASMASLEMQLQALQKEYEERWKSNEQSARQVINSRLQQANAARQDVEDEIQRCDKEREKEDIAALKLTDEHKRIMSDAKQATLSDLESKLQARQRQMQEQVAAEHRRCEALRSRHLRKTTDCQQEVLHYSKGIESLRMGYRDKSHQTPRRSHCLSPMPRESWMVDGRAALRHAG